MRKSYFLIFFFALTVSLSAQNQLETTNQQFDYLCRQWLYTNASNLLIEKGNEFLAHGDTLAALELQFKNCQFTDEHLEDFFRHGLTWDDYFANWYMTISLEGWTNKKYEGALHLFSVLRKMQKEAPYLLPYYSSTLAYIIDDFRDPVYSDSIYLLQAALDYIKTMPISRETVKQYIRINECFMRNRFYNSIDGVILIDNKLPEIREWYIANSLFIHNLDANTYYSEILQYNFSYADFLHFYASSIGAQVKDPITAINLYEEEIAVLEPLLEISNKPAQKIAMCYSHDFP